jgi:hypothetical protein
MPFIDAFPDPTPALSTASRLNFIFDILPAGLNDLMRELWIPRLKVDGVEVQIQGTASVNEDENSIGETLTVELLKVSDRVLFTSSASIDFGIGRKEAGVWDEDTFITLLSGGSDQSINRSIAGPPQNIGDRVSVTIISSAGDKLNKTSPNGLIIYDSDRSTIADEDLKPLIGATGVVYSKEIIAVPGLKLSDLFSEVLITKCGFTGYETDLPENDYPIQRYEVKMGERFFDGLKGFIGMYSPAIVDISDTLWITDTTTPQPAGFPAPKQISLDRPLSINIGTERQRLDALMLQFVGLENNYDFTSFAYDYPKSTPSRNTVVESEIIDIEFRKITSPTTSKVIRTARNIENRRTLLGGEEIDNTSEVTEFTSSGRPSHIRKTTQKLVPDVGVGYAANALANVLEEKTEYAYQPHPFLGRAEYCARKSFTSEGVISVDTASPRPDGSAFKRDITLAHYGGNINDGQTLETGPIKTRDETFVPLRNGNVLHREFEIDEVTGLVLVDRITEKPGEIAMSAVASTYESMPVFAPGVTARTAERVEPFSIRELPLRYGLPLAERVLLQRQSDAGTVNMPLIGYDPSLKKGIPVQPLDRDGASLGNFLITGRKIDISANGVIVNLTGRAIAGSTAVLQNTPSYARTIEAAEELIFTRPVTCTAGYSLSLDPSTVDDLTIEARHVEIPELAWTDLSAGSIDLTVWDGTDQDFEIRITASSPRDPVRERFAIVVDI